MKFVIPYLLFGLLGLLWLWGVSVETRPVLAQVATPSITDLMTLAATYINPFLLTPLPTIDIPSLPNPGGTVGSGAGTATPTPTLATATVTPTITVTPTATVTPTTTPLPSLSPTPSPTPFPVATALPTVSPTATVPAGTQSTILGWGITIAAGGIVLLWISFMIYLVWRSLYPARYR